MQEANYCPFCGEAQVMPNPRFCYKCGEPFPAAQTGQAQAAPTGEQPAPPPPDTPPATAVPAPRRTARASEMRAPVRETPAAGRRSALPTGARPTPVPTAQTVDLGPRRPAWLWLLAGLVPALILVSLFYVWANAGGLLGGDDTWTPPTVASTLLAGGVVTTTATGPLGGATPVVPTAGATTAAPAVVPSVTPTASSPTPSRPAPSPTAPPASPTPAPATPTPATGAGAPGTGTNGARRIAFVSERTGSPQIWIVDVASGEQRALTTTGRNENPAWSPDNRYLYYSGNRDGTARFYRYELATGREEMLSDVAAGGQLTQAPDGRLAFVRQDGDVYRLSVGGRDLFTLDRPFSFAWSPDGNLLLMDALAPPRAIHVLDLRDGGSRQVADNGWNATWAPDRRLLYASDREGVAFLYVASTDGSDARILGPTDKWSQAPAWSPEGGWIAYVAGDGPAWNLYLMTGEGTNRRLLAPNVNPDRNATWEPSGTRVAYESNRNGNWDIYIRGVEGTERQLTRDAANDRSPAWSW